MCFTVLYVPLPSIFLVQSISMHCIKNSGTSVMMFEIDFAFTFQRVCIICIYGNNAKDTTAKNTKPFAAPTREVDRSITIIIIIIIVVCIYIFFIITITQRLRSKRDYEYIIIIIINLLNSCEQSYSSIIRATETDRRRS